MYKTKIDVLKSRIIAAGNEYYSADLKALDELVRDCESYVVSVTTMERVLTIQRHRLDPESYREAMQKADRNRRMLHEGVMASLEMVNRLSTQVYGGEKLFTFADRHEAAEIAIRIVDEYFESGQTPRWSALFL
jgi:hypothetical protein